MRGICVRCIPLLACAAVAVAGLEPIGDPIEGGSWRQQFKESGIGDFDLFAVRIVSGGPFETNLDRKAISGFTSTTPPWAMTRQVLESGSSSKVLLAVAQGPKRTSLNFVLQFFGLKKNPLTFDYVVYNEGSDTVRLAQRITWTGTTPWQFEDFEYGQGAYWAPTRLELLAIPAPAAAMLGAIGLGLVGWVKRRLS